MALEALLNQPFKRQDFRIWWAVHVLIVENSASNAAADFSVFQSIMTFRKTKLWFVVKLCRYEKQDPCLFYLKFVGLFGVACKANEVSRGAKRLLSGVGYQRRSFCEFGATERGIWAKGLKCPFKQSRRGIFPRYERYTQITDWLFPNYNEKKR